jgi:hypothetical protein
MMKMMRGQAPRLGSKALPFPLGQTVLTVPVLVKIFWCNLCITTKQLFLVMRLSRPFCQPQQTLFELTTLGLSA